MITMFRFLMTICLCLLLSKLTVAVEVREGGVYAAGTRVESSQLGLSFTIPIGWQGQWPTGGEMFVLTSMAGQGYIFVYVDNMNAATVQSLMSQRIPLDQGIVLNPKGSPVQSRGAWVADYDVIGSTQPLSGHIETRIGPHGIGVAFISVAPKQSTGVVNRIVQALAGETQFKAPKQSTASVTTSGKSDGGVNNWQEYMRGRYIVRYYTGSGYHEEDHLWLCSDGTFMRSGSSGGFSSSGASGAYGSQAQGKWQAKGSTSGSGTLTLAYNPGRIFEGSTTFGDWTETSAGGGNVTFNLALNNKKLYLDGKQWLRDRNQRCP